MIRGARLASCDDLGQGAVEVLPVVRGQRRDETAELRADLGVERGRGPAPGVGQRRLQCAPVAWHGRSPSQTAPLGPVHEAGERGLLHAVGHLAHVFIEAEAVPLRNTVVIPGLVVRGAGTGPRRRGTGPRLTPGPEPRWPPFRPDDQQRRIS